MTYQYYNGRRYRVEPIELIEDEVMKAHDVPICPKCMLNPSNNTVNKLCGVCDEKQMRMVGARLGQSV